MQEIDLGNTVRNEIKLAAAKRNSRVTKPDNARYAHQKWKRGRMILYRRGLTLNMFRESRERAYLYTHVLES